MADESLAYTDHQRVGEVRYIPFSIISAKTIYNLLIMQIQHELYVDIHFSGGSLRPENFFKGFLHGHKPEKGCPGPSTDGQEWDVLWSSSVFIDGSLQLNN